MICQTCEKEFEQEHGNQKYCSYKCQTRRSHLNYYSKNKKEIIKKARDYEIEVLEGINSYFWQTYVIPAVKNRDGNKCIICGSTRFLEVHHKKINVSCPTIKDLVTLCKSCHKKEHVKLKVNK